MLNDFIANGQLYSPDDSGAPAEDTNTSVAGDKSTQTQTATDDNSNQKMFTQEQTENLIKARVDKLNKKYESQMKNMEQDILSRLGLTDKEDIDRLNDLQERLEKEEQRKLEEKGQFQQILDKQRKDYAEQLNALEQKSKDNEDKYISYRKQVALQEAALKAGADPTNIDMVVGFTEKSLELVDDNTFRVIDYDGSSRIDPNTGKDMTLETYMKSFLSERPGLLKSSGSQGAGSHGSKGAQGYTLEDIRRIASTDMAKYKQLAEDGTVKAVLDAANQT